jgi:hypothetical protein
MLGWLVDAYNRIPRRRRSCPHGGGDQGLLKDPSQGDDVDLREQWNPGVYHACVSSSFANLETGY